MTFYIIKEKWRTYLLGKYKSILNKSVVFKLFILLCIYQRKSYDYYSYTENASHQNKMANILKTQQKYTISKALKNNYLSPSLIAGCHVWRCLPWAKFR